LRITSPELLSRPKINIYTAQSPSGPWTFVEMADVDANGMVKLRINHFSYFAFGLPDLSIPISTPTVGGG
jgi:hypothetical protein